MEIFYLFLESLSRIEELLNCMVGLATEEKVVAYKKNRASVFREKWLDKMEVLLLLKIGERTLFNLRKSGKLPSKLVGGKMYFNIDDVEKLMAGKEAITTDSKEHTIRKSR
ncbi:helix-turn-helix domain-containing protein [Pedobacter alpinus]|uniref:Helix-turn-helix domain-containing protein n=1 Tax=Pedobacter alpinus TaxID=1590643 RepID=A0ABW5TRJ7_9SPHI